MESGTALVHGSYINTARDYAFQLGKLVQPSFNSTDSKDLLRVLELASAAEIQAASVKVSIFCLFQKFSILISFLGSVQIKIHNHQCSLLQSNNKYVPNTEKTVNRKYPPHSVEGILSGSRFPEKVGE